MFKQLLILNSRTGCSFNCVKKTIIDVKMSHASAMLQKTLTPIHVASQIPDIYKHLEKALPLTKIKIIKLPNEFSPNIELGDEIMKLLSEAEILICDNTILAKSLFHVPKLKWAHCTWAGVEPVISAVKSSEMQPPFVLTRHSGMAFGTLMAEYVICQIINWERRMRDAWNDQQTRIWGHVDRFMTYKSLSQLVVCVLGVGNMGCAIAKFLKCFGATVLGLSRSPKKISEYPDFEQISTDIAEILPKCEYLCNTLPSTPETYHLLGGDMLSMCSMKPVFINVGRGNIIQEEDLLKALRNGWISGAILDVFEREPLPESSQLWNMPQVVITPHIASISRTDHIAEEFLKNYERFTSGEELKHTVDWNAGY